MGDKTELKTAKNRVFAEDKINKYLMASYTIAGWFAEEDVRLFVAQNGGDWGIVKELLHNSAIMLPSPSHKQFQAAENARWGGGKAALHKAYRASVQARKHGFYPIMDWVNGCPIFIPQKNSPYAESDGFRDYTCSFSEDRLDALFSIQEEYASRCDTWGGVVTVHNQINRFMAEFEYQKIDIQRDAFIELVKDYIPNGKKFQYSEGCNLPVGEVGDTFNGALYNDDNGAGQNVDTGIILKTSNDPEDYEHWCLLFRMSFGLAAVNLQLLIAGYADGAIDDMHSFEGDTPDSAKSSLKRWFETLNIAINSDLYKQCVEFIDTSFELIEHSTKIDCVYQVTGWGSDVGVVSI